MNIIMKVVSALFVAVIGPLIVLHYSSEKADLRFTLSDRIPVRLVEKEAVENLQQLEIKNVGNSEARKIHIFVASNVKAYEILKNSKADSVQEYFNKDTLEILYDALPPEGSIKLLIKTVNSGINIGNLTIRHSKGKASGAFERSGFSWLTAIALVGIIFIYIVLILSAKKSSIDSYESKAEYRFDEILTRGNRPFHISENQWNSIRSKALRFKADKEDWGSIEKSTNYTILSISKPDYLTEEEWVTLRQRAVERLSDRMIAIGNKSAIKLQVLNILHITRPLQFPETKWAEVQEHLNKLYFQLAKKELFLYGDDHKRILDELNSKRPEGILENLWDEYTSNLREEYFKTVSQRLERERHPIAYLEQKNLAVIKEKDISLLKERAYKLELEKLPRVFSPSEAELFLGSKKPEWIHDKDYDSLSSVAHNVIKADSLVKEYEALCNLLESILDRKPLMKEKPSILSDEKWERIIGIDERIKLAAVENEKQQKALLMEAHEVSNLKGKIERQLEIIHGVLIDPTCLDRVESYSNPFMPGNFENLQKIAAFLKKRNDPDN